MGNVWCSGAAVLAAALACACGSDDRTRGGADGGGGGGDSGPRVDAAGVDSGPAPDGGSGGIDAGAPPAGARVFDASDIFEGSLWLAGTITLPEAASGHGIQINVAGSPDEGFPGNQLGPLGTTDGATLEYAVTGLAPGTYSVQLRVDATGDGMLGSSGDWEGWYDGTVAAPITDRASAAEVEVRTGPVTGIDFGIGVVP